MRRDRHDRHHPAHRPLDAVVTAIHDYAPTADVESLDTGNGPIDVTVRPAAGSKNFTVTDAVGLLRRLHCTTFDGSTPWVVGGVCTKHHVAVWVTVHVSG